MLPTVIFNFRNYWKHPLVNKYINGDKHEGILILEKGKKPIWISHPFYFAQAKKETKGMKIILMKKNSLKKILSRKKKIGYDERHTTVAQMKLLKKIFKGKKLVDVSSEIEKEREIKTKEELEKIGKASKETKKVIGKIRKILNKGVSEKKVEKLFEKEFEKNGFSMAFCIVAFGSNTKELHHIPGKRKLKEGEEVLIDVGAKYKGYCADISESFWFGKKQSKKRSDYEKELRFVKDKLEIVKNCMKPGIKAKKLWKLCEDMKMPHALGHGLGLEEHDYPPGIGSKSEWKLKEGMILAIEPGLYKRFGIRVEKDFLITKKGCREL